jgi:tetratricopeptide (TPR) repeat protein
LDAGKRLARLREQFDAQRLSEMESRAAPLLKKGDLEGALALYEELEKTGLEGNPASVVHQKITGLQNLIDTRAYKRLIAATEGKGPERIDAYRNFLKSYPENSHRKEVEGLISKMSQEYYYYTENRILENEKEQNWNACLKLSQRYIDIYPFSENAVTLTQYQALCKVEKRDAAAFQDLKKRARTLGDDYSAMAKLYSAYLKSHPETHSREAVEKEIARVKALAEQKRLDSAADALKARLSPLSERFIVHGDGTVSDAKTGLMWSLLDSTTQLNRCLDFEEAEQFVADLKTGGHTDWRLPTKEELTELYHQKPAFPSLGTTWYWTSQTHKKYLGRWMIDVDVVTTETKPEEEVGNKASWHCGAVRAVRGKRHR